MSLTQKSRKDRKSAPAETAQPVERTADVPVAGVVGEAEVVTVATTEPDVSKLTSTQAAKQFEVLVADAPIPAERKTGTAENARWFLRKGWIFCTTLPQNEELRKLAQALA